MKLRPVLRAICFLMMLLLSTLTATADNCSGGADCTVVPANNTGANVLGSLLTLGTLGAMLYNNNATRKEEEEEIQPAHEEEEEEEKEDDEDISIDDFILGTSLGTPDPADTTRPLPIDDPLGTDPPIPDSTTR